MQGTCPGLDTSSASIDVYKRQTLQMAYGGSMLALTADFSTASAASFMVFTLLYLPCTAAFATLKTELGSWKAAAAAGLLQTGFAWLASFAAWQLAYYFL